MDTSLAKPKEYTAKDLFIKYYFNFKDKSNLSGLIFSLTTPPRFISDMKGWFGFGYTRTCNLFIFTQSLYPLNGYSIGVLNMCAWW